MAAASKMTVAQRITETLRKRYGKDLGEDIVDYLGNEEIKPMPRLKSQCMLLDKIMGGGWPLGRICEVFGGESTGKTTLCIHALAEAQKMYPDKAVGFIDKENSFDPLYAMAIGLDVRQLVISQPDSGQAAFTILEGMIVEGCKVVVVDSVAAMVPREEVEGEFGDNKMGVMAKMMSQGMRKINDIVRKYDALVIFTNQTREKIGVVYGNPETTTGGNALKFYTSIRLRLQGLGKIETGGEKTGIRVRAEAVKNKTAPPYRRCEYAIVFGKGIDNEGLYFTEILERNLVEKGNGSFFIINGEKVNGKAKLQAYLESHPEVYDDLKRQVDDGVSFKDDAPKDAPEEEAPAEEEAGEV
ncbi:MAG: DNA recombination/repair protein RecA [Clostridia bacterium]|nr:DNA recombination/repair protein RecA [Clostridia bacterium]